MTATANTVKVIMTKTQARALLQLIEQEEARGLYLFPVVRRSARYAGRQIRRALYPTS